MLHGTDKIHETVTRILANIEEDTEDGLAEVSEAILVVNVHYGNTDDDGDIGSTFYACTSAKGYIQRGLVEEVRRAIDLNTISTGEES